MKALILMLTGIVTSFVASVTIFLLTGPLLAILPLGRAYFRESLIKNVTYGEIGGSLLIILLFAYLSGLAHGYFFRGRHVAAMTASTLVPALSVWLMFIAMSLGMAFYAFPVVIAYGASFWTGTRHGKRQV